MAELILFHHAQGLTVGVEAFAGRLRAAGHEVTVPDLYDGATFGTVEEGVAHAEYLGFDNIIAAGAALAESLPKRIVYAGFSLGALLAHNLAQTRSGALGALLYHHGDVPITTFGPSWPAGVDMQLHINERDPWCELDIVQDFVRQAKTSAKAELFLYPGSSHLFTDSGLRDYEPDSAELVLQRTIDFLQRHNLTINNRE
jgi:dienelactone hydrolase